MKIRDLGEFELINRFSKCFSSKLPAGVIGIGDDAAVIPENDEKSLLITADMLIEDVHFLKKDISPTDLGYKALAVNLSDIAAMGGVPDYAVLSLALNPETEVAWVDSFFEGFEKLAKEFNVHLVGGDTTRSLGPLVIHASILGHAPTRRIKLRSSAQPGDIICVTANLGDSGAGLKAILENVSRNSDTSFLIEQHHRPRPYLKEGQWLAGRPEVHAMMDVSDGIDSDLRRIMEQSRCGVFINLEKLPLSKQLLETSAQLQWNPFEVAATAGEDYCLVLTIDRSLFAKVALEYQQQFETTLYPIGEINDRLGIFEYSLNGKPYSFSKKGFEHFS